MLEIDVTHTLFSLDLNDFHMLVTEEEKWQKVAAVDNVRSWLVRSGLKLVGTSRSIDLHKGKYAVLSPES